MKLNNFFYLRGVGCVPKVTHHFEGWVVRQAADVTTRSHFGGEKTTESQEYLTPGKYLHSTYSDPDGSEVKVVLEQNETVLKTQNNEMKEEVLSNFDARYSASKSDKTFSLQEENVTVPNAVLLYRLEFFFPYEERKLRVREGSRCKKEHIGLHLGGGYYLPLDMEWVKPDPRDYHDYMVELSRDQEKAVQRYVDSLGLPKFEYLESFRKRAEEEGFELYD